jgi:hypothetical protein
VRNARPSPLNSSVFWTRRNGKTADAPNPSRRKNGPADGCKIALALTDSLRALC